MINKFQLLIDICKDVLLWIYLKLSEYVKPNPPSQWSHGKLTPIIILPGFGENFHWFNFIASELNQAGHQIILPDKYNSLEPINSAAQKLANFITSQNLDQIIIVGHSKGGLIARQCGKYLHNDEIINRIFTIATPHYGTILARFAKLKGRELMPHREGIWGIDHTNDRKVINIYPAYDNIVEPDISLQLPTAAANIKIDVTGHSRVIFNPKTLRVINNYLEKDASISNKA